MKRTLFFLLLCTAGLFAGAQKTGKPAELKKTAKAVQSVMGLRATYFVKHNRIMIRWAPVNEEGWRWGNKYGYVIERRTVVRDGKLLGAAEQMKSYRSFGCAKDSLRYWDSLLTYNDNAAVMAQALYGESFQLDLNQSAKVLQGASLLSKSEEAKQRYLFALYAADNDFDVATRAGLGFLDTAVSYNEKYFYRICSAAPKALVKSDTALLFVTFQDMMQLPQTADVYVEPSNKSLVLSWDMDRTRSYYNSFVIQRSADGGKSFQSINRRPYTSMGQGNDPHLPNAIVYVDTSVQTSVAYQYRVAGINIFGERGPWSAVAEGKSLPLLEGVPGIGGIRLDGSGRPIIHWYFEDSIRKKLSRFELTYSPKEEGPFTTVAANIPPATTEAMLPDSLQAGYLIVKAVPVEGLPRTSFPYLFQPEDSLPPSAPTGLAAKIDSSGRVQLSWLPNTEKDLLGYKVFRTMMKGGDYAVLVDTVWKGTVFYDTLDLKLMNRTVYYAVSALDYRFNRSAASKEIEVVKPDVIPPTSPVFADYRLKEGAVEVSWINPEDDDLAEVALQRKDALDWRTVFTTRTKAKSFSDTAAAPDRKYSYRLVATDGAGLRSPDGQVLTVQTLPLRNGKLFKDLQSDLDRDKRLIYLHWTVQQKQPLRSIEVFRGSDKDPLQLYKVLDGKRSELLDNELTVNTKYKYAIRAVLPDGRYSELMIKEINY